MPPRLLVVYKKSQLQLYREHEPSALADIQIREPAIYARFVKGHDENAAAIDATRNALVARGITASYVYRADHETTEGVDAVVAIGGDGTLLDVSHAVLRRPLLGINSSTMSVGHFCAATIDEIGRTLDAFLAGELAETPLSRLSVEVNGVPHPLPVLNEVLYAATVPASVSRYRITIADRCEEQKSSGMWISTAAGSTAAILSAGGQQMAKTDTRMQYLVREPYLWAGAQPQLLGGMLDEPIRILSKMRTAAIYIDGHREQIPLSLGDRVVVAPDAEPLRLLGFRHR